MLIPITRLASLFFTIAIEFCLLSLSEIMQDIPCFFFFFFLPLRSGFAGEKKNNVHKPRRYYDNVLLLLVRRIFYQRREFAGSLMQNSRSD